MPVTVNLKKRHMVGIAAAIVLVVAVLYAGWTMMTATDTPPTLRTAVVTIEKKTGGSDTFTLEIASDPVSMEIGLMYRKHMADDRGMLFYFGETPREVSFWMKNTYLSLDMLFVDENGRIAHIHHRAEPLSLTSIPSRAPVTTVIEINGGLAEKRGIRPGDHVDLSAAQLGPKK